MVETIDRWQCHIYPLQDTYLFPLNPLLNQFAISVKSYHKLRHIFIGFLNNVRIRFRKYKTESLNFRQIVSLFTNHKQKQSIFGTRFEQNTFLEFVIRRCKLPILQFCEKVLFRSIVQLLKFVNFRMHQRPDKSYVFQLSSIGQKEINHLFNQNK